MRTSKNNHYILIVFLFISCILPAKLLAQSHTISGYVTERNTGEKIIFASVVDKNTGKGVSTNNYGFYSLKVTEGKTNLLVSYVGFEKVNLDLNIQSDTTINITLKEGVEIENVTITSNYRPVTQKELARIDIPIKEIKQIPVLFGEADVFKAIQLMPGIQSGLEGSAGIYVRGGNVGDNLFLIDGIPVYNPNHLYGFFSVFNTDAVKNVTVYKGAFPARYSGGTSSVIDVRIREGSTKEYKVEGSVGLISSKIKVEGPIVKDKTAFLISGRRTYIDLVVDPLKSAGIVDDEFPSYNFYDLNFKLNHKVSEKSHLYFSFYKGDDKIKEEKKYQETNESIEIYENKVSNSGWGNTTGSVRWNQRFGSSLFSNLTLAFSNYDYRISDDYSMVETRSHEDVMYNQIYSLNYKSNIKDLINKLDFNLYKDRHTIRFGLNSTFRELNSGESHYKYADDLYESHGDTAFHIPTVKSNESNIYLEDEFKLYNVTVNVGANLSIFFVDSKTYTNFQPRISAIVPFKEKLAFKASASRMVQHFFLISEANFRSSSDAWISASEDFEPQSVIQYDLGFSWQVNQHFEFSAESYYKDFKNVIGQKNGETIYLSMSPLNEILEQGTGKAYGAEFQLKKTEGKTTGWINYTLAKSERTFPTINNGKTFPFRYDRRHALNIVMNHRFNKKVSMNAAWIFGSGYPQTLATVQHLQGVPIYSIKGAGADVVEFFNSLYNHRLPVYHRLDLGVSFHKTRGRYSRVLSVGLFNAYARNNPIYQYYGGYKVKTIKSESLLPIIPYVTYSFKF